eukprot:TRINITY_DN620_c0_g2_i2.p1 TRINITY_DN620_c0_g2~~TRINITY_DN620_c0_g2_i2.p1  ORF type:complete len:655 (+),score=160.79 TRINITY_DN620_c0_g2_i2:213-2177(+)
MNGLKSFVYLPHAMVKAVQNRSSAFVLTGRDKTHTIAASATDELAGADAEKYLLSWKNTFEYVIERAQVFKGFPTMEGWLSKRGGRGHDFKNTKKRHFVLKGNMLAYFSSPRKSEDDISNLKGFIDVAQISALLADTQAKSTDFSVVTNGGREYILIAKDVEESERWMSAIRKAAGALEQLQFAVALGQGTEEVVRIGKMQRITSKGHQSYFFALTSKSLRFYSSDFGSIPSLVQDFGKNLAACIPLLGATVEHDPSAGTLAVLDVTGNSYLFSSKGSPDELRTWEQDISTVSKNIARQIIRDKGVIRLNTYVLPENDDIHRSKGYCVITVSPRSILLNFLMLRRDVKVPWSSLKAVDMIGDDIFCLKYKRDGEMKQLNIRSRNASGLYDTIEAVHEEVTENPQEESEEDKRTLIKKKSSRSKMKAGIAKTASKLAPLPSPLPTSTPAAAAPDTTATVTTPSAAANQGTSSADNSSQDSGDAEESQSQSQSGMGLSRSESSGEVAFHTIDNLPPRSRSASTTSDVSSTRDLPGLPANDIESSDRTDPSGSGSGSGSGSDSEDDSSVVDDFADDGAGSDSEEPPMMPSLPSAEEYIRSLSRKSSGTTTSETLDEESGAKLTKKVSTQSVDDGDHKKKKRTKKPKTVQKTVSADAL